jgi:hypothetical protein
MNGLEFAFLQNNCSQDSPRLFSESRSPHITNPSAIFTGYLIAIYTARSGHDAGFLHFRRKSPPAGQNRPVRSSTPLHTRKVKRGVAAQS